MRKTGVLLFSAFLFIGSATAADLKPLTPQDAAKVQELLRSFDPHSYEIHYRVQDPKRGTRPFQAGLANLRQSNTVRPQTMARPAEINIFRPPVILVVINVFAQIAQAPGTASQKASGATTDPLLPIITNRPDLQMKAQQLNQLLAKYYVP
jgi:hypothetical protein